MNVDIRANGQANSQVTTEVKDAIADHLEWYGVEDSSSMLITHYCDGKYVCISRKDPVENIRAFNDWFKDVLREHPKNRRTNSDTLWVHREWISQQLFEGR